MSSFPPAQTPELTPAPVTTSQLDGLYHKMQAGHTQSGPYPSLQAPNPTQNMWPMGATTNNKPFVPPAALYSGSNCFPTATNVSIDSTTSLYMALSSSQPIKTTNTNQSIDQGTSFPTELEVDVMNTAKLQFYKKKDNLTDLLKILPKINTKVWFNNKAGILNRATPAVIAAMWSRAATLLTTLRLFNSTNRTYKQL
ncbi:hypothetical protein DFH28DRAFT_1121185 [Melampsora americana]|nr:hypothetical protein DFH28DRAFT_1121185 [Melampsora americana]